MSLANATRETPSVPIMICSKPAFSSSCFRLALFWNTRCKPGDSRGTSMPCALSGVSSAALGVVNIRMPPGFSARFSVRTKAMGEGTCSMVSDAITTSQVARYSGSSSPR